MKTVKFQISKIDTRLNKNDKLTVMTEQGKEQNPSGVFQFTEKHLDNLADSVAAVNADMLKNAIAGAFDPCYLVVECKLNKAGEVVTDRGEALVDEDGNPILFTKDHWGTYNFELELGEDALEYISELNKQADLDEIKEARKAKKARKRKAKVNAIQTNVSVVEAIVETQVETTENNNASGDIPENL